MIRYLKKLILYSLVGYIFFDYVYLDVSTNWALGFQDPATPIMEGIINLHHDIMYYCVVIFIFVVWFIWKTMLLFRESSGISRKDAPIHGSTLEIIWTLVPAVILIFIAFPSFALLYSIDEFVVPQITLKVIGHQWYWSYEYTDFNRLFGGENNTDFGFDSYMIPTDELEKGQLRLLEVDNPVVLPIDTHIRVLITAADVLHCWAIPSLGVKMDACPGHLNEIGLYLKRCGTFYGQCSEICGVNHGYMPIRVDAVDPKAYVNWLNQQGVDTVNTTNAIMENSSNKK